MRHVIQSAAKELQLAATILAFAPIALLAQTAPPTMEACYVPASGTTYRINTTQSPAPGAPSACVNPTHVRFAWNQQGPIGATGPTGPAGPAGSSAAFPRTTWDAFDFANVNGFMSKGLLGTGASLGTDAYGTTLLWYPKLGAFRAGLGDENWDEQHLGQYSVAMGYYNRASGLASTALGQWNGAFGKSSIAMGHGTRAVGDVSTAMGLNSNASGYASTAMGAYTVAQGKHSVAMGTFAYSVHDGSFVFGDNAVRYSPVTPDQPNQFLARASGGVVFQVSTNGQVGCYLTSSSGGWQCTSDRNQKRGFTDVDGEGVLGALRTMPITTWQYRADSTRATHLGPTAQDFRAAFSLGRDSVTIGAVDAQGVALAASKALEERTRKLAAENAELRRLIVSLSTRLERIETRAVAAAQSSAASRRRASSTIGASSRSHSDQSATNRR